MNEKVIIYTDGACRGNPGVGAWGAVLRYGEKEKRVSGAVGLTTNNQMELRAAIEALSTLKRPSEVILYTDSNYLKLGISEWLPKWKARGWKTAGKNPVKNLELWQQLEKVASLHQIEWRWVRGHRGNEGNELADALANEAIDRLLDQTS